MRHQARMLVVVFDKLEKQITESQTLPNSKFDRLNISYAQPRVFEQVVDKLGLLGPRLSFKVVEFYFLFFDVLGGLDAIPKEEIADGAVLQVVKSMRGGLKQVWESGTALLPELIAFAHTKKRPKAALRWMIDDATESGQSNFNPSDPFEEKPFSTTNPSEAR